MFSGYTACLWVHPSVYVYFCVQNTSFCQITGRGIKSHLVTAVVYLLLFLFLLICDTFRQIL